MDFQKTYCVKVKAVYVLTDFYWAWSSNTGDRCEQGYTQD